MVGAVQGGVIKEGEKMPRDVAMHVFPINPEQDLGAAAGTEGKQASLNFASLFLQSKLSVFFRISRTFSAFLLLA